MTTISYSSSNPAGIGVVGCGNIARRYLDGMSRFPELELIGCTDRVVELAETVAAEFGLRAYASSRQLLEDPDVDVVVNITPPTAHAAVAAEALRAGKHVYVEKPMTATVAECEELLAVAEGSGRRLGSAPDTFLGSAAQTARAALDAGLIGDPIGAVAFVTHSKAETWHPDPSFLFQPGGGPALDLGPYYVTSLVNMLGPVESVSGFTRIGSPVRTMTAPDRRVESIEVRTPTHVAATMRFVSGVLGTVMMSFDVWDSHLPKIEVYGQLGTLTLPDPNFFDGPVLLRRHDDGDWQELEPVVPVSGDSEDLSVQLLRGIGVADLVRALGGEPHRATAALARHVLEVLEAMQRSSDTAAVVPIRSTVERPARRGLTV
jgi:predicted dehydrogenase